MKRLLILLLSLAPHFTNAQYWDSVQYHRMESDTLINWVQYGPGNGGWMSFLRYHPRIPEWCFLGPDMGNNYQTENNGESWYTVKDFDGNGDFWRVSDLYYSSLSDSFALAIEMSRLWTSQDTGKSWQIVLDCPWYDTHNGVRNDSRSWFKKVSALAIDPNDDDTWYIGGGAYPRTQQQQGWFSLNNATASNPRGRDSYSGDETQGKIYRSKNAGAGWEVLRNGIHSDAQFSRIIVHPENSDMIFAASNHGLFRSSDGGASWINIGEGMLANNNILDMDFYYDPASSRFHLYLCDLVHYYPDGESTTNTGGIYISRNNGDSWNCINGNLYLDLNQLTGGVSDYYYKYIANWFGISETEAEANYPVLPDSAIQRFCTVTPDPTDSLTLYVGFWEPQIAFSILPGRLWKTSDGGKNWTSVARNYGPAWEKDSVYWNARNNPVTDNMAEGHQPSNLQFGSQYPLRSIRTCVASSTGDLMMLASHNTYLSTDKGDSWHQVDETLTPAGNLIGHGNSDLPGERLLQDKRLGSGFTYLATGEHKLMRSTDDGTPERPAVKYYENATETVSALRLHPWDSKIIFTSSARQRDMEKIMRSTNGGNTWTEWGIATPATEFMRTNSLQIDPLNPRYMYFGVSENKGEDYDKSSGCFRSEDGGKTFSAVNNGLPQHPWLVELCFDPRDTSNATLFAAVQYNYTRKIKGGLYYSNNRGDSWSRINIPSNILGVNAVVFDHSRRMYITAGSRNGSYDNGGVWYSDDFGLSWVRIFRNTWTSILDISPFDRNRIICINGTLSKNPGVFISEDRGQSWSKNNRIFGQPHNITDVEFDLFDPTTIHLSIIGSGFYRGSYPGGADARKISLGLDKLSMDRYETIQLEPQTWGGVDVSELNFSSDKPLIASVNSEGVIRAHKQGATMIRAISADERYSEYVYLSVSNEATKNLRFSTNDTSLLTGDTLQLDLLLFNGISGENLSYESSDSAVVDVDESGIFLAKRMGECEVSIWSEDRIFSDICRVRVQDSLGRKLVIMNDSIKLFIGDTAQLDVAHINDIRPVSIKYQVESSSIISVSATGQIIGRASGTSMVYAYVSAFDAMDQIEVEVKETIPLGSEPRISTSGYQLYPNPITQGDILHIEAGNQKDIYIYDLKGVLIYQQKHSNSIDTGILAPGAYFIKLGSSEEMITRMLLVN